MEVVKGSAFRHSEQEVGEVDANQHHLVHRAQQFRVGEQTIFHAVIEKLIMLLQNLVDVRHVLLGEGQNNNELSRLLHV